MLQCTHPIAPFLLGILSKEQTTFPPDAVLLVLSFSLLPSSMNQCSDLTAASNQIIDADIEFLSVFQ